MPFAGFGPQAQPFFTALAFHQTREWFEANRGIYEDQVKAPLGDLVEDLGAAFASKGLPLKGDRKSAVFRLNRDIRFSNDKSPYKTHAGAVMTRSGAKNDTGVFYIHIDPKGCFAAAGFHTPEPPELRRLRRAAFAAPAPYRALLAKLKKAGLELDAGETLTRPPREFAEATHPDVIAAVKLKSFIVRRPFPDKAIASPDLVKSLVAFAEDSVPLLRWGWSAVVDER
jgi:uncharacterized protein (TIGR02453 family)